MYKPTKEEIAKFKKKYPQGIHKIVVEDKCAIFKTPDRKIIKMAAPYSGKNNIIFNETILRNSFVAGDSEILEEDSYFLGAQTYVSEMIEVREASIEKL